MTPKLSDGAALGTPSTGWPQRRIPNGPLSTPVAASLASGSVFSHQENTVNDLAASHGTWIERGTAPIALHTICTGTS